MPVAGGTVTSGTLTRPQLRELAKNAGFPDDQLDMAVEVAIKESSGNPRAKNSVPCYGLWQINMRGSMGTERRKVLGLSSNDQLYDPATNARAAKLIYDQAGGSWSPWTTANAARAALGADNNDVNKAYEVGKGVLEGPLGNALVGTNAGVNSALDQFTEKFRLAAVTYLVFLVALVCLILGIVILNRNNTGKIAGAALNQIPQIKAVKKVLK